MASAEDINFNDEVKETLKVFPGVNDGQRFARAVLEFAFGLSHEEAINANSCDGSRDRGLDAYFSDDDYFYLMQFKYHDDPFGKSIQFSAAGPVSELTNCWNYVSNLNQASTEYAQKRIRQELYDAAVAFQDEVQVHGKGVKLVVVEWADGATAPALASGNSWVSGLGIGHHIESFEVENFHSIRDRWEQRKAPLSRYKGSIELSFLADEGQIGLAAPHQAIVVHVPGKDLAQLFNTTGDDLFDPNVRFGLTKSKFNPDIKDTAINDPANFWYFNNGITIICGDFRLDNKKLIITDPGVVNGGQTIKQLHLAGKISDNLKVLVRVIKSQSEAFDGKIALYTNSQNAITQRDLVSNHREQIRYQTEFRTLPFPWFYERKRGSWDILDLNERRVYVAGGTGKGRKRERRLTNELVGKAVLAFSIAEPVIAKTDTPALWTREVVGGYYDAIFCKSRDVYELAVSSLVYQVLDTQRAVLGTKGVAGGIGSRDDIKDCIPHLTAIVGRIVRQKYSNGPLRQDFQRMYNDLMDQKTQYIAAENFVTHIFYSALLPFVVWYNTGRRQLDPRWESSNWYKGLGNWNRHPDTTTMVPAYDLYGTFTPQAAVKSTTALVP